MIYIFSDGFADQFGGEHGKKFKYKPLQQMLLNNYTKPAAEQKAILERTFTEWTGNLVQVDDVLVIGVRI
jgi:serine phosphatase RsbU (regulator of sigma subunit)